MLVISKMYIPLFIKSFYNLGLDNEWILPFLLTLK